ncbi:DUF2510 domain-containing protein [Georgenia sp. Z1491]|uniref:DUF2510 domain-containing protein n=1 Tax=Georgenia sp. Z1491 TaxID=3416707 RepID=UPI003CEF425E
MSTVEAGWYSDPWEDGKIRFWDGVTWTDEQYDAEDSEYDVHGAEDPTPPVDHTVAPSSVLQAGQSSGAVAGAQDVAPADQGLPPSAPSAPGYGQMPPSAPSAPGYGQMPPSAPSAPGYGQMPPSAPSAAGYGVGALGQGAAGPHGSTPSGGSGFTAGSGWSAGSSAEAGWAGQTGPGFYGIPGAGSPGSTGPVVESGSTAQLGDGYGGYAAAGAGSYPSGGTAAYPQGAGAPWAASPEGPGGFGAPPQVAGYGAPQGPAGYAGPQGPGGYQSQQRRSGLSPLLAGALVLAIVAVLGVGAYFMFFSGDDDPTAGGPGGDPSAPVPGPAPADALTFTDSSGAEVPESGQVQVPAGGAWTGTLTVTERTGFLALAASGDTDPQIAVSGEGVSVDVDDVGSASSDLAPLGGSSGLDAAVGLVLEPGTYTVEVTDWRQSGGTVPFEFRSGLAGTLSPGAPVDVSVAVDDVALLATEPAGPSGSVHTLREGDSDPQLVAFPTDGSGVVNNDDGAYDAPSEIGAQMSNRDAYVEVPTGSPTLVVVSMWREEAGDTSVIYTDH